MQEMRIVADKRNVPLLLKPVVRVSTKRSSLLRCELIVPWPGRKALHIATIRMEQN